MKSLSVHSPSALSRRLALGRVGAAAAAVGLSLRGVQGRAVAQDATPDLANHPLTGMWLAMANQVPGAPQVPVPSYLGADGTVLLVFPLTQVGSQGVEFVSPYVGTWEADGERRAHFTATQLRSDASGAFLGSVTVDGYPEASADGKTFIDDNEKVIVTIRDAAGAVVQQVSGAGAPPITGIRMAPGAPGFPDGTPDATPAP